MATVPYTTFGMRGNHPLRLCADKENILGLYERKKLYYSILRIAGRVHDRSFIRLYNLFHAKLERARNNRIRN